MSGAGAPEGRGGPPRRGAATPSGGEYAGAGLQLAVTIVAFMFLGIWLDKRLGSSPWFVILCVFAGAAAGFYSLYRRLMAGSRRGPNSGGPGE